MGSIYEPAPEGGTQEQEEIVSNYGDTEVSISTDVITLKVQ